ncbi:MAG TPA: hypothetical protein VGL44_10745 [Gaiellales bacterium]
MRIPGGRRRAILVAAVAVIAGVVAVVAVLVTRGGGDGPAKVTAKPLAGQPPLFLQLPGPAVKGDDAAVYAAARARLPAGDVRVAIARAIAGYGPATRDRTVATLRRLPQSNPAVAFELGLAQLWSGHPFAAEASLHSVRRLNPYGYYGTKADNLLHLNEAQGYPPYILPVSSHRSLAALRAAVAAPSASAADWLALASALEGPDRLAALKAARTAAGLDPTGVSEQVAVAVLGFSKDLPMTAISALGNLASEASTQDNAQVRFHLGLLYFWIRDSQDAAAQFTQVEQDAPKSPYAQVAHVFGQCLKSPALCQRIAKSG